jgi:hypothetical protein
VGLGRARRAGDGRAEEPLLPRREAAGGRCPNGSSPTSRRGSSRGGDRPLLSLARKAGQAVAGFEKVKDWLVKEEASILLQASDGSERGQVEACVRRPEKGRFFGVLTASEIGLSFGREHVIHAALAAGGLTDWFREDAIRLSGVREDGRRQTAAGKAKKDHMSDNDGKKTLGLRRRVPDR